MREKMAFRRSFRAAASLLAALLLSGCSATVGNDVESLLRAPRLSGETGAVQKALNSYLGSTATMKYPASGDFLSPFLFGDWDGDGTQEAAVLYTEEAAGQNTCLAILEPVSGGWQVTQTTEGLSNEVESVTYAHLWDTDSLQILVGYSSAQGDHYLVVYQYSDGTLRDIIRQNYTDMILADITGRNESGIQDLILALPTETENGGVNLQLLTNTGGEFHSAQTLAVGAGVFNGCAALHAGTNADGSPYLVVDAWNGTSGNSLASAIIVYDEESGFLQTYTPAGISDIYRATLRDASLFSVDLDGNGTIDIPTEVDDGGTIQAPMDKQLRFLLWKDFDGGTGGTTHFGIYDSEYRFFLALPESMHGSVLLRSNWEDNGWMICNAEGTTVYCELRVVDPSEDSTKYRRVATIGSQQLQVRIFTDYYGLSLEKIQNGITLLE